MKYAAFLRAVNLGPHRKLSMAKLRTVVSSLGWEDTTTYLQSGNLLFGSSRHDAEALEKELEQDIRENFGMDVPVLIRSADQLASAIAENPLPHALAEPSRYYLTFLNSQPNADAFEALDESAFAGEEFRLGHRVIYVRYPQGLHQSKLNNAFWERRFGVVTTSRNWNTVTRIRALLAGPNG